MTESKVIKEIRAFNRFYTNIIGVVDRHILDSPHSLTEARVLYEICHDPHVTARTMKRFLLVDEGYLSRTIEKLVKQGLIAKKRSVRDGRSFDLSLTEKGRKEFLALDSRSDAAVESMIEHLGAKDVTRLVTMMRCIHELLTKEQDDGD